MEPVPVEVALIDEQRRDDVNDARLWHPWLRINRVLRVMLRTRWSTSACRG